MIGLIPSIKSTQDGLIEINSHPSVVINSYQNNNIQFDSNLNLNIQTIKKCTSCFRNDHFSALSSKCPLNEANNTPRACKSCARDDHLS